MLHSEMMTIGFLEAAPAQSLFLSDGGELALVVSKDRLAVFPSAMKRAWQYFECEGNQYWKGVIIPEIEVEIDASSRIATNVGEAKSGDISYVEGVLSLLVSGRTDTMGEQHWECFGEQKVQPTRNHPPVIFKRWNVIVHDGEEKHILLKFENGELTGGIFASSE